MICFCNISVKIFPQIKVMHIQIPGHEDHSPLLIIHISKTACSSSIEFSAVCTDALFAEHTHNYFDPQLIL